MNMNTEKRALLAIVLSMVIIVFSPFVLTKFFPEMKKRQVSPEPAAKETVLTAQTPVGQQASNEPSPIAPAVKIADDKTVIFETDDYRIDFTAAGGAIKSIVLKKFPGHEGQPLVLSQSPDSQNSIFYASWSSKEIGNAPFLYRVSDGRPVFTAKSSDGLLLQKEYIFHPDSYAIELKQTVTNNSAQPRPMRYSIVTGSGINNLSKQDEMYVEVVNNVDGKITNKNKKSINKEIDWDGRQVNWVSMKNRYFSLIVKPPESFNKISSNKLQDNMLQTKIESMEFTVGPNASVTQNFILYAGPNDYDKISALKMGMEDSIYLGFTGSIGRILFMILRFFHSLVKNWGLAIIALTAFINILLFPLTYKGIKAMKQMQALQPKMEALRKAYKDNPQKLNKETMELYKKYKINPMGGCLPMLLQMPVFFALYQVLMKSTDLRGASFLWIKDLSMPDRLVVLNGHIPLLGNELNILPILMAGAMFLQQKLSAPPSSSNDQVVQQQKMMAVMMPVLFGFLFYRLPSGLVMYWLTNTILTVTEQELFLKKEMFHVEHSE